MRTASGWKVWTALALWTAYGCGSTSPKPADGGNDADSSAGPTAQQACSDFSQAECAERTGCSAGSNITRTFGNIDECVIRETLACLNGLGAPQTGNSPTLVEACVAAYATYSCADFFNDNPPASCAAMGSRATAAACAFNAQCASGYCAGNKTSLCGTCSAPPSAGASCLSSGCGHGQSCVDTTMLCQAIGTTGSSCDGNSPCGSGLSCVGNIASTSTPGTCQPAAEGAGTACGGSAMPACDGTMGWFCGGAAGSKTCIAITYVTGGMPCGDLSTTSHADCIAGGCYTGTGPVGSGQMGTCLTDVAEGAACDTVLGPDCLEPARCVKGADGSAGTCTVPTGSTCN